MFRATCGKKGKVDFWVMRACEAITRVVEEAGYWSLRDTRDKTGEGRKEENSFVSTATEHPEKDILNLFRSLWA